MTSEIYYKEKLIQTDQTKKLYKSFLNHIISVFVPQTNKNYTKYLFQI